MGSFSSKVKEELSKINNLSNKKIVKSELQGYLLTSNNKRFITENEYNINRFSKLLSNNGINEFKIEMIGNKYCITTKEKIDFGCEINNEEEAKAIIRGSFMGAGSITNPKNKYHLEIMFGKEKYAEQIENMLKHFNINAKKIIRGNKFIVYIKDGEDISNFLALVGAKKSLLEFEDTRVIRDVRNNVNRIVNCETANLNKVIKTSVKQIEAIKLIKKKKKFNKLSEKEKELANLRLQNPNATLLELGKMLKPAIGKSGVNHRMKAIEALAEEIKNK